MAYLNLIIVLLALMAIYYAGTRLINVRPAKRFQNKSLKVKEYLPLEPQVGLYLVTVGAKDYLVGVGNRKITQMAEVGPSFQNILEKESEKE
jgi:flagellar biogenesis protein FliO